MAGIPLASGFDLGSPVPLDSRVQFDTIALRDALPTGSRYEGLLVYVKESAKYFSLIGSVDNANWKEMPTAEALTQIDTTNLATKDELQTKADATDVQAINTQLADKASVQQVQTISTTLASTVKTVNGVTPSPDGNVTIQVSGDIDTTNLATKQEMKHYGLNLKTDFAAVGGGVIDDTSAFESLIAFINQNPGKYKIEIPQDIYKIRKRLPDITRSNVIINANFSTFIWDGTDNTGNSDAIRNNAVFNFRGSLTGSTVAITSVNFDKSKDLNIGENFHSGLIQLGSTTHGLQVGDYIQLTLKTGDYSTSKLTPEDTKILRINNIIDNNKLYVNYWSPYEYRNVTFSTATVQKCIPLENISIRDFTLHDILDLGDTLDSNATSPNRERYVCGLSFLHCVNVTLENVTGINTKLPVIYVQFCEGVRFKKGYIDRPYIIGGGEGYLIQVIDSVRVHLSQLGGQGARHILDFTGGAFCTVDECDAYFTKGMGFQQHGKYEHNITYTRCVGKFNGGSGESFGNAGKRIFFNQCKILIHTYDLALQDVYVTESDVRLDHPIPSINCRDSLVDMFISETAPTTRIPKKERKLIFDNCKITLHTNQVSGGIFGYDELTIKGGSLEAHNKTALYSVQLGTVNNINIKDSSLDNVAFEIRSESENIYFNYLNNKVKGMYSYAGFISLRFANNCTLFLNVKDNHISNDPTATDTTVPSMFRIPFENHENVVVHSKFKDNIVTGVGVNLNQVSVKDYTVIKDNFIIDGSLSTDVANKTMADNHLITTT